MKKEDLFFVRKIFEWGEHNFREFEWRKTSNPYCILIAEFLLQKTHSRLVEKVYTSFVKQYPTTLDLKKAKLSELEDLIGGLGLKYRAKRMKDIAVSLSKQEMEIPSNFNDLIKLQGVGSYIANSILCFAFNQQVPIVDTNIYRIYVRYFGLSDKSRPANSKLIWNKAKDLLPEKNFKKFNWLLLDFGAIICKSEPVCSECPLKKKCIHVNISKNSHRELRLNFNIKR